MQFCVPFVAMIAVIAGAAFAQTAPLPADAPTGWVVDGKTGCKVREDAPDPAEKITWSGRCEDGMAEGSGTVQFYIGDRPAARYDGEMRGGRADGHGVSLEPGGGVTKGNGATTPPTARASIPGTARATRGSGPTGA